MAKRASPLSGIDAVLLAGGLGIRLRGILNDRPKVLAPVAGRPILDHLLDALANQGCNRAVLCLGYRAAQVQDHLATKPRTDLEIAVSIEPEPLGTAGALRHARLLLRSDPVLVLNADTLINADLGAFLAAHRRSGADATVLCVQVEDASRFGTIDIDAFDKIVAFREKDTQLTGPAWINAGFYLFSLTFLDAIGRENGPSLEKDIFQRAPRGTLAAFRQDNSAFIDIGMPESFRHAQSTRTLSHKPKIVR